MPFRVGTGTALRELCCFTLLGELRMRKFTVRVGTFFYLLFKVKILAWCC